jgi:hypothetical protein
MLSILLPESIWLLVAIDWGWPMSPRPLPDVMQQLRERNPNLRFEESARFRAIFQRAHTPVQESDFDRDLTGMLNELTDDIRFLRMSLSNGRYFGAEPRSQTSASADYGPDLAA